MLILLSLVLIKELFVQKKPFRGLIRKMLRAMWTRKRLNLSFVLLSLSFFDFSRRLPESARPDPTAPAE